MKLSKIFVFLLSVILITGGTIGTVSADVKDAGVKMYMQNPQHTGISDSKAIDQFKEVKWKFKTGGRIYASPIVIDGTAYIGSEDKNFYAVDIKTGKEKWHFATGGGVDSSAAIADNKAYFASKDGYFYAVDIKNGSLVWKFKTNGEKMKDEWDYFLSSPIVADGMVYFGSGDSNLYALDMKTGKKIWSYKTDDIIHASPTYGLGNIYIGSFDGGMYALEAKTGKLVWKFQTLGYNAGSKPIQGTAMLDADGGLTFGSRDFNIYTLEAKSGKVIWNIKTPSWVIATPVVKNNTLYYGNSDYAHFYSYDMNYGYEKWSFPISLNVFGSCILTGNTAYFGSFNGKLYAVDIEKGKIKWSYQTDESKANYSKAVDENDKFRFSLWDNHTALEVYDIIQSLGSIVGTPAVEDGTIYFGSTNGCLYALQ